jgi:cytochrome c
MTVGVRGSPPDFTAIANRPSTTALSLKVFFKTSHRRMPNLIIAPEQADDLANYILSLKRN